MNRHNFIFLLKAWPRSEYFTKHLNITNILAKINQSHVNVGKLYQYKFTSKMVNSVHPDQLASEKPADLDAHCFRLHDVSRLSMIRILINA